MEGLAGLPRIYFASSPRPSILSFLGIPFLAVTEWDALASNRLFGLFFFGIFAYFTYLLLSHFIKNRITVFLSSQLILTAPIFFSFSLTLMPQIPLLAFIAASLYFYLTKRNWGFYFFSALAMTLRPVEGTALFVAAQYLVGIFRFSHDELRGRELLLTISLLVALAAWIGWLFPLHYGWLCLFSPFFLLAAAMVFGRGIGVKYKYAESVFIPLGLSALWNLPHLFDIVNWFSYATKNNYEAVPAEWSGSNAWLIENVAYSFLGPHGLLLLLLALGFLAAGKISFRQSAVFIGACFILALGISAICLTRNPVTRFCFDRYLAGYFYLGLTSLYVTLGQIEVPRFLFRLTLAAALTSQLLAYSRFVVPGIPPFLQSSRWHEKSIYSMPVQTRFYLGKTLAEQVFLLLPDKNEGDFALVNDSSEVPNIHLDFRLRSAELKTDWKFSAVPNISQNFFIVDLTSSRKGQMLNSEKLAAEYANSERENFTKIGSFSVNTESRKIQYALVKKM